MTDYEDHGMRVQVQLRSGDSCLAAVVEDRGLVVDNVITLANSEESDREWVVTSVSAPFHQDEIYNGPAVEWIPSPWR